MARVAEIHGRSRSQVDGWISFSHLPSPGPSIAPVFLLQMALCILSADESQPQPGPAFGKPQAAGGRRGLALNSEPPML
jgi:hypothetical protein